jgi:hypothetical protein
MPEAGEAVTTLAGLWIFNTTLGLVGCVVVGLVTYLAWLDHTHHHS